MARYFMLMGWKINVVKMSILPKAMYRFNAISIKVSMKQNKKIQTFVWNHRRPRIARATLRKKNKASGMMVPAFKLYFKTIVIKTALCWHKTDTQINGTEHRAQK